MMRISVIVPVFNVEDALERCIESILAQTYGDLDVILVDDGSTDASGIICDSYAELDYRVRVFHTDNRGLSAARNFGLDRATDNDSHFIAFVDSDDYLEPCMFERLIDAMNASKAEIVQCGYRIDGMRGISNRVMPPMILDRKEALIAHINGDIVACVWNKLYQKRIFREVRFPEGRVSEDMATTYRMLLHCGKFVSIPYVGYHYVMRKDSISHTHTMKNLVDYWIACKDRYDCLINEEGLLDEKQSNALGKGVATAISRMWRWAYGNGKFDRTAYRSCLLDMQVFEQEKLRSLDKREWPLHLRASLVFSRSCSSVSLAAAYYANQLFVMMFPKRSGIRR